LANRALTVATELELADLIAEKQLHVDVLAAQTKTHSPSFFRLLRALESVGIFTQVSAMVFANTLQSECMRKNVTPSLWAFVRAELSTGGGLSIRMGERAFDQIYGYDFWALCRRNPRAGEIFNEQWPKFGWDWRVLRIDSARF
jgi:hypothetical protein